MKRQRKRLYLIKTRGLSVLTDSPFSTDFDYKIVFFDFSAGELWNPNSICIHPAVIRRIAVCIHCAGGGIQIVVQAVYLYPAGCHLRQNNTTGRLHPSTGMQDRFRLRSATTSAHGRLPVSSLRRQNFRLSVQGKFSSCSWHCCWLLQNAL